MSYIPCRGCSTTCRLVCDNANLYSTIQKRINNQVYTPSSMFILKINTCSRKINNNNEGKKYDSYHRVLQKRRACITPSHI
jgi:hypothetical protein